MSILYVFCKALSENEVPTKKCHQLMFFGKYHTEKLTKISFPIFPVLCSCELQLAAVYHKLCLLKNYIWEGGRMLQKRFTQYIPKLSTWWENVKRKGWLESWKGTFPLSLKEDFNRWVEGQQVLCKTLQSFLFNLSLYKRQRYLDAGLTILELTR